VERLQMIQEVLNRLSQYFVLMICSAEYKNRLENRVPADQGRGVFWEGSIPLSGSHGHRVLSSEPLTKHLPSGGNAAAEPSLTILQVSDMQFGRHHQFPQEPEAPPNEFDTMLERIWDDIKKLRDEEHLHPDLLICTGDLAEWAWQKEFADAFQFLGSLAERLELKRERVVIIPGNHDVHRKECQRYFERCVESAEPVVAPWYPKWQQYERAFSEFYKDVPGVRFTPDEPWSLFVVKDLEVVIAGLNSTWIEGHDWPTDEVRFEQDGRAGIKDVTHSWGRVTRFNPPKPKTEQGTSAAELRAAFEEVHSTAPACAASPSRRSQSGSRSY
jgi:hypothetical protein